MEIALRIGFMMLTGECYKHSIKLYRLTTPDGVN